MHAGALHAVTLWDYPVGGCPAWASGSLTLTVGTPPLPYLDGFGSTGCAGVVVVGNILVHRYIIRAVQHHDGEVRQIDLIDLLEDGLALRGIIVCCSSV